MLLLGATGSGLVVLVSVAQLFLIIWISLVVGSEFVWGTTQSVLVNAGMTRVQFVFSKLSLAVMSSVLITGLLFLLTALATALGVRNGAFYWPAWHSSIFCGVFLALLTYAALTLALAMFSQSGNNALLLGILAYAMEWLIVGILPVLKAFGALGSDTCGFFIGIGRFFDLVSVRANANLGVSNPSEDWPRALIVLMIYVGLAFGASFVLFLRRDLVTAN